MVLASISNRTESPLSRIIMFLSFLVIELQHTPIRVVSRQQLTSVKLHIPIRRRYKDDDLICTKGTTAESAGAPLFCSSVAHCTTVRRG
jgi:hypothetical protein